MKIITVYRSLSLNAVLILAAVSILFCWFTGILPLYAGFLALKRTIDFRRQDIKWTDQGIFKLRWAFNLSIIGLAFCIFFTLYYFIALVTGGFIGWFW
jgi:hypothetical protein